MQTKMLTEKREYFGEQLHRASPGAQAMPCALLQSKYDRAFCRRRT
jgi:hypothetical protein